MGQNRQVQIYMSKNMGSRNWVKFTEEEEEEEEKKGNATKTVTSSKLKYYQN